MYDLEIVKEACDNLGMRWQEEEAGYLKVAIKDDVTMVLINEPDGETYWGIEGYPSHWHENLFFVFEGGEFHEFDPVQFLNAWAGGRGIDSIGNTYGR